MPNHEIVDFHAATPGEADAMAALAAADLATRRGMRFASVTSVRRLDARTSYRAKITLSSGKPPPVTPKKKELPPGDGSGSRPMLPGMARSQPARAALPARSTGAPDRQTSPDDDLTPVETPAGKAKAEKGRGRK